MSETIENKIEGIKEVHRIQGAEGNWDYDDYMVGLYNGLELALAILENRRPDYRTLSRKRKFNNWFRREVLMRFSKPVESEIEKAWKE